MAISDDLFLAILAMDSYNRGYNEAVQLPGSLTSIGNASVGTRSDTQTGSAGVDISFYAQTYNWDGQAIISYRGTDDPSTDIFKGYPTAAGLILDPQAAMAIQFYKSVVAQSGSNVLLTGHSLGAGLAGLVGALFNKDGVLFDNMPFQLAAQNVYDVATGAAIWLPVPGLSLLSGQQITDLVYGNATPWAPTFDQLENIYIPNYEIGPQTNWLAFARSLWATTGQGQTIDETAFPIPSDTPLEWTNYNKVGQRHDASLLVIRMFLGESDLASTGDWKYASKYLLPALFDQQLANAIEGAADLVGPGALGDVANAVRSAIAYSAIDEGTRVFGDTGIRAFQNDATDLGSVLKDQDVSKTLQSAGGAIGKVITQFAGHLAVDEVMQSSTTVPVTDGVISVSQDGNTLAVDFGDQLWSAGTEEFTAPDNIVGRKELTDVVFKQSDGVFEGTPGHPTPANDIRAGMKWLWNDDNSSVIDRFVFATKDGPLTTTLPNRSSSSTKVSLFAAGGQNDNITGSRDNDFIFGGNGNDTLRGGDGDDLLAGGKGDDRLNGGAGRNFLTGGEGKDTVFYEASGDNGVRINAAGITDTANPGGPKILQLTTAFGGPVDRVVAEKVELTNKPDTFIVDRDALKVNTLVDMGESNRQASPSNLDVYDLSNVGQGVSYFKGEVAFGTFASLSALIGLTENLRVKNADKIILTPFNDTVVSANFGNVIHTGAGHDTIWIGSDGVAIDDLSKDDRLTIAGVLPLFGGIRNGNKADNPYGYSFGGAVRWAEDVDGALQVSLFGGPTTYILNWAADSAGKTVDERPGHISLFTVTDIGTYRLVDGLPSNATIMGWWDFFGALVKTHFGLSVWKGVDPLTLDLDGDGLELAGVNSLSASFDFNADGYAERTGWVRPDDGILVRDINGNGRIDNITEMFGGTTSGFAQLALLDGNHDGKVDAADNGLADFNGDGTVDANDTVDALKVWRDLNEDGVTQAGELFSLADVGIASIVAMSSVMQRLRQSARRRSSANTTAVAAKAA